jgi:hypothetical protein
VGTRQNLDDGSICLATKPFSTLPMIAWGPQTQLALLLCEMVNTFHYEVGNSWFIDSHMEFIL